MKISKTGLHKAYVESPLGIQSLSLSKSQGMLEPIQLRTTGINL